MSDQDFEQRLARRLREYSEHGVRPYDAVEVARGAMWARTGAARKPDRGRVPIWFRSVVLAGLLVLLLVGTAVVGGFINLPGPVIGPSPTPTTAAIESPSPSPIGTGEPSPTLSPEPSPTVGPSPTVEPSPSPTATPPLGWREIDFPGHALRREVRDVAYGNGIYVAVGLVTGSVPAESVEGRAWYSNDGETWTRAAEAPDLANVVVATEDAFYALDPSGPQVRTWRSTDGTTWSVVGSSAELAFVNDLAYSNGVMVAVGANDDFDAARVWTSTDGISWTSIAAPPSTSELTHVAARAGGIVVIGDTGAEGHGRRLHFLAAGSSTWQTFDPFGEDMDGRLVDIASNGSRFVAVGYEDELDRGLRSAVALSSADGANWTRTVVRDGPSQQPSLVFDQVVALPDGRFLAVASDRQYAVPVCRPGRVCLVELNEFGLSFVSTDGTDWRQGPPIYERTEQLPPEIGDQIEHDRKVAAGAPGVVVIDRWEEQHHVFFAYADSFR